MSAGPFFSDSGFGSSTANIALGLFCMPEIHVLGGFTLLGYSFRTISESLSSKGDCRGYLSYGDVGLVALAASPSGCPVQGYSSSLLRIKGHSSNVCGKESVV